MLYLLNKINIHLSENVICYHVKILKWVSLKQNVKLKDNLEL